jgi:hypothetical protein
MTYRVIALPTETADQVRRASKAPKYGHPAHTEKATGYGPCRHSLHTLHIGQENRVVFTYDPFTNLETVPLSGPISRPPVPFRVKVLPLGGNLRSGPGGFQCGLSYLAEIPILRPLDHSRVQP